MAVLDILKFPDNRLRKKCTPVQEISPDLIKLADDMLETMYASFGLGLSAIQVNHFVRLLTADTSVLYSTPFYDDKDNINPSINNNERYENQQEIGFYEQKVSQPVVLFNPHIISRSGTVIFKEGCLSFPSYYADVKRSAILEVTGLDKTGKKINIKTDGVLAICLQHEIDHLDGKLFIDHLSAFKAKKLQAQIKKHGYPKKTNP